MGKVSAGLVRELRDEVNFQIERLRREIRFHGPRDGLLQSLHRMRVIRKLLCMLLNDGEIVLAGAFADTDNSDGNAQREGLMVKIAKFFKMYNPEEM